MCYFFLNQTAYTLSPRIINTPSLTCSTPFIVNTLSKLSSKIRVFEKKLKNKITRMIRPSDVITLTVSIKHLSGSF